MARPVVLIYQETATTTVTPTTPDLNCLVVGPAYWVMDYLDDKASIKASSAYGTKNTANAYVPPVANTTAITLTDAPGNKTGAVVDSTSVAVYFDKCRVLMAEDVSGTTGATIALPVGGLTHNKIVYSGASTAFIADAAKAKAGDYVIVDDPSGTLTYILKTVQSVDTTNEIIYVTTNFKATEGHASNKQKIRIEREVTDVALSSSFTSVSGNTIKVLGGATTTLTGESTARRVQYAEVYVQYKSLRTDLADVDTVSSETDIKTKLCNASTDKVDSRNPLAGCCLAALKNTTTPIQFYGLTTNDSSGHSNALTDLEGRTDIYAVVPITEDKTILSTYKTKFEGLASAATASSTGIPQKWRVILGAQDLPTSKIMAGPFTAGAHSCVGAGGVPNTAITAADVVDVFVDTSADFVTAGILAGDKLVIITDTAAVSRVGTYTVSSVYDKTRLRTTTAIPGPAVDTNSGSQTGNIQYYIIRGAGSAVASTTFTGGTTTGASDKVTANGITGTSANVDKVLTITASSVTANKGDWLISALAAAGPPAEWTVVDKAVAIVDSTGVAGSLFSPQMAVSVARAATSRRPFRVVTDAAAAFSTSKVLAGDFLQVPNPITGSSYTTTFNHKVAYIANENTLVMDANIDVVATAPITGDTTLKFQVSRTLSKDNQITELVSISQSFKSRRVSLVWPNKITVGGLVDGSKTRTVSSTAEAASAQPGYYLAAVVGGMTAGLPSHQGFTNLGIAGISKIENSTRYFSDTQLTTLSDGGWFVFGQVTTSSLPYCIHQLTTDPSTLEAGEYSVVKNFDYISLFFQDILDDFLGDYNINDDTLSLLRQALITGIDLLKLRKFAKIGAPLNSASITSLGVHATVKDRVEIYMNVSLPKPLNRIGLHLVSV